jgi:DUF438 domain-containing protein
MVSREGQPEMERSQKENVSEVLTHLLKRINQGANPKGLRKEARQLISSVTSKDIASAEQNLINKGFTPQLAGQLSSVFVLLGILEEQSGSLKERLPASHILRKVFAEHELLLCFLADFIDVSEAIGKKRHLSDTSSEFMKLSHIVEHLNAMEEHIEREESIIFPYLKKHGWDSLCRSAHSDHVYIKIAVNDLITLIGSYKKTNLKNFKTRLNSISKYLGTTIAEHVFQEDNILYPIAIEVIDDKKVWDQIKTVCEDIGYCGVHL